MISLLPHTDSGIVLKDSSELNSGILIVSSLFTMDTRVSGGCGFGSYSLPYVEQKPRQNANLHFVLE